MNEELIIDDNELNFDVFNDISSKNEIPRKENNDKSKRDSLAHKTLHKNKSETSINGTSKYNDYLKKNLTLNLDFGRHYRLKK